MGKKSTRLETGGRDSFDIPEADGQEPPGTPRVTVVDTTALVAWDPGRDAMRYKVLCNDLQSGTVGFIETRTNQVQIENLQGKYRLDVMAFGPLGASPPKQVHFVSFGKADGSARPRSMSPDSPRRRQRTEERAEDSLGLRRL